MMAIGKYGETWMKRIEASDSRQRHDTEISAWENAGSAPGASVCLFQYGRRIEGNGSWTIYHVFTGIPAEIDGLTMVGLDASHARRALCILNTHRIRRPPRRGMPTEE